MRITTSPISFSTITIGGSFITLTLRSSKTNASSSKRITRESLRTTNRSATGRTRATRRGTTRGSRNSSRNTYTRRTKNGSRSNAGLKITLKDLRRVIIGVLIIEHLLVMSKLVFGSFSHLFKSILLLKLHLLLLVFPLATSSNTTKKGITKTRTSSITKGGGGARAHTLENRCEIRRHS